MKTEKLIDAIERWRWFILGAVTLICAFFLFELFTLKLNPTPYFIDRTHASRIADHRVKELFTSSGETAIVVAQNKSGSIYSREYLQRLQQLTDEIRRITLITPNDSERLQRLKRRCCKDRIDAILADGLDPRDLPALQLLQVEMTENAAELTKNAPALSKSATKFSGNADDAIETIADIRQRLAPILRVRSLTTLEHLASFDDTIDVGPLLSPPYSDDALRALPAQIHNDPLLQNLFVSRDESASAILVELGIPEDDSTLMIAMHNALMNTTKKNTQDAIYIGGPPMVTAQTSQVIQHDNFLLTPIVTVIMAGILWWSYRRIEAVIIPLTVAGATTLITLGTMATLGIPLNIVTTVLPVFLISMIIADSVHVLNSYFIHRQTLGHSESLRTSFKELWYPMVFYSATTMIGFITMMNTDLTFLRQLGWFVLLGLAVGLLFNLALLPALLSAYRTLGSNTLDDNRFILWVSQRSVILAQWVIGRRNLVAACLFTLTIAALALAAQVKSHNEVIGYFNDGAQIKQHEHAIRNLFGGTTPFNLWLSADKPERFRDPEVISALGILQRKIEKTSHVSYVASLYDYIENAYRIISDGLPNRLQRDDIAQHLFFYENARDRDIRDLVDLNYQNARMFVVTDTDNTQLLRNVINDMEREARQTLPSDIKVKVTGFAEILVTSAEEIIGDQAKNVVAALVVIWLAMLFLYRSFILALVAVVPLTLSILLNLALMALIDIPLNIGTALIATVTFGVGIDYAIHIMNNVRNSLAEGEELRSAILEAVRTLASGICINSLSVGLGCLVLVASQYQALQNLGILVASGMIICAAMTLISLPMLAFMAEPAWRKYRGAEARTSTSV